MASRLYAYLGVGLGLLYLAVLRPTFGSLIAENDLWWMIPEVLREVKGKSAWEILAFLLSPDPQRFGQPVLKAYLFLVTSWLGLHTSHLVLVSVAVHFANAGLLYLLARELGFRGTAGFFSSSPCPSVFKTSIAQPMTARVSCSKINPCPSVFIRGSNSESWRCGIGSRQSCWATWCGGTSPTRSTC